MATTPHSLEKLVKGFLLCKEVEGRSPKTTSWYRDNLARFCRFIAATTPGTAVADIGLSEARAFVQHLQTGVTRWEDSPRIRDTQPLAATTVRGYVRTLKVFWNWLEEEGYVQGSPLLRLKQPRAPRKIIQTFSKEQIAAMLGCLDLEWPNDFRTYTIVLLFLDTGLRLSELAHLQIDDIDIARSQLCVMGKGAKERVAPFGTQTRRTLHRYMQAFRFPPLPEHEHDLFTTESGTPLKVSAVKTCIRRLRQTAGITGVRCSPHTFRHTFAKNYLLNGGDVFSLQRILGHSSLEMVRLYVNLADSEVNHLYRAHSPIDNLLSDSQRKQPDEALSFLDVDRRRGVRAGNRRQS